MSEEEELDNVDENENLEIDEPKNEEASRPSTQASVQSTAKPVERDTVAEIMAEKVQLSRPLVKMKFTRKFKHFGREIQNMEEDANDSYRFFPPVKDPRYQPADHRVERDFGIQCGEGLVETSMQTEWFRKVNHYSQVNISESVSEEDMKSSNDETSIKEFLNNVSGILFEALDQNLTIDIFKDDFQELSIDDTIIGTKSESQFIEVQSFPHAISKTRKVSCADWQPNNKAVLAISTIDIRDPNSKFQDSGKTVLSQVYIWSFQDPTYPSFILNAPLDVYSIQFNPAHPHILAGGMVNGQVILWNIEQAEKAYDRVQIDMMGEEIVKPQIPTLEWAQVSLLEMSHTNCVTAIQWLPKGRVVKSNAEIVAGEEEESNQFLSLGLDSKFILWDMRKDKRRLTLKKNDKFKDAWIPFAVMPLMQLDLTSELPTFALSLSAKNPYHMSATTTEGEFVVCDWSPVRANPEDATDHETTFNSVNIAKGVHGKANSHIGMAHSISRHPFFDDIIMTIGKQTCKIWKVGCPDPIWTNSYTFNVGYSCGGWSPTRPGVMLLGRTDGYIEVWDFLDKSHDYSMISHFSISQQNLPLTELKFRVGHGSAKLSYQFIAVGTQNASLSVVEVPKNLIRPLPDEEKLVRNYFNREYERVLYFTERWNIRDKEGEEKKLQGLDKVEEETASESGASHTTLSAQPESIPTLEKKYNIDKVDLKKKFLALIQQ